MEKDTIKNLNSCFEEFAYEQDGVEYWMARELQDLLGYSDWRNFNNAVNKAKESCKTSGEMVFDHFVDVNKMIEIGKGGKREIDDIRSFRATYSTHGKIAGTRKTGCNRNRTFQKYL